MIGAMIGALGSFIAANKARLFVALLLLAVAGSAGAAVYYFNEAERFKGDPRAAANLELQTTVASVGKLLLLPTDETPTLATVTDAEKLKDQPFFAKAQNGDKVLIYTTAKIAILYRPGENKIIAVGTVNLGTTGQ